MAHNRHDQAACSLRSDSYMHRLVPMYDASVIIKTGVDLRVARQHTNQRPDQEWQQRQLRLIGAFAGIFGALLMDQMTAGSYDTDNYRYGYLFKFAANVISFLFLLGVFLYWRKMGGEKGYVAPEADGKHLERAQAEAAKKA